VSGRSIRRWLRPSIADLLGVFIVVSVVLIGGHRLFRDSDPATHVATGYWVLEHREVPRADPFSGSHAGQEWFAFEWLADIAFAVFHGAGGWGGVVVLSALLIAGAHLLLYRFLIRRGSDPMVALVAVLLAAASASSHWLARPHLWTVFLLVVWVVVLEEVVQGARRAFWLAVLPITMLPWVNLHGGFLVALPVLACYLVGSLVSGFVGSRAEARSAAGPLAITLVAATVATLANPWGWHLLVHLVSFSAVPPALDDFAPASIRDRAGLALFGFLVFCLAGAAADTRSRWLESRDLLAGAWLGTYLAFGMTTVMAFMSIRHVEVMAIFGAVIAADGFSSWLWQRRSDDHRLESEKLRRYEERHGGAVFAATLALAAILAVTGRMPRAGFDPGRFPVEAVHALKEARVTPTGPVLAPDLWGGYLILEWPEARVFVDARWDMYGRAFMEYYASIYAAQPGWPSRLEEAGVSWALLPVGSRLAAAMDEDPGWARWRADPTAVVFRRSRPDD
jgi:hypothetical protein